MADNIDRDWNEMCNNLKDVIQIQVNFVHSISEKLQNLEIGTGSGGGVGEWIEPGTQYTYQGTTYTVGTNVERFNLYGETGDGVAVNQAAGSYSHVEGYNNKALGGYSHAEGYESVAVGNASHAEGKSIALGSYAHAEGMNFDTNCGAIGTCSHVEGYSQQVTGDYSHAEGYANQVRGRASHAEGMNNNVIGDNCHAEGYNNNVTVSYSHAEGSTNLVAAEKSHVEGERNQITTSDSIYGHIEGYNNLIANSVTGHAEGDNNKLLYGANRAHVEGYDNIITGDSTIQNAGSWESHCEGRSNYIFHSYRAHCEGQTNKIYKSDWAHNEGDENTINRNCDASHAEGMHNTIGDALGNSAGCAHVQGDYNTATGSQSSATGYHTTASGINSTTMGYYTRANGSHSVAMGSHTIASAQSQFVLGEYNVSNPTTVSKTGASGYYYTLAKFPFIIGNGYIDDPFAETEYRSDAFKVDCDGKIYVGDNDGVDVSGLNVTSSDNNKVLTATYSGGVGTYSWQDAPESSACIVHTYTDTALPAKVVLDNNNEYRYLSLTNANSLTISIETIDTTKSFYSTIVLHNVSSTDSLSTFVTVSGDSVISNIVFLNENNVDLSTADTAELLFFTNGMSNTVMCIAYAYGTSTP